MATISMTNLNKKMKDENINIHILESLTRKHIYQDMLSNRASKKDISDVVSVLGCRVDDLYDTMNHLNVVQKDVLQETEKLEDDLNKKARIRIDICDEIKDIGFNKTTFMEYINISIGTFHTYITKRTPLAMNSATSLKIAYGLNCSIEYLFGLSEERGHSEYKPDEAKNKNLVKVVPLSVLIHDKNISPSSVAKFISIPYLKLKKLMITGGYMPKSSLKNLGKLYNMDTDSLLANYNSPLKRIDDSIISDAQTSEPLILPIGEVTAEHIKRVNIEPENESLAQKMTVSTNDNVSLSQLAMIASIMSQKPELLQTFNELCSLNNDDYNHIHDHLKWLISKSKTEQTA